MARPVNVAILLNYLLSGSESPKNLYFCMFVEELVSSGEKKETLARWSYEIYSTFLMNNAVRIQLKRLLVLNQQILITGPAKNNNFAYEIL